MRVFHRRKGSGQSSAPGAPSISDASPLLARANSGESYETSDEFLARVVLQADVAPAKFAAWQKRYQSAQLDPTEAAKRIALLPNRIDDLNFGIVIADPLRGH